MEPLGLRLDGATTNNLLFSTGVSFSDWGSWQLLSFAHASLLCFFFISIPAPPLSHSTFVKLSLCLSLSLFRSSSQKGGRAGANRQIAVQFPCRGRTWYWQIRSLVYKKNADILEVFVSKYTSCLSIHKVKKLIAYGHFYLNAGSYSKSMISMYGDFCLQTLIAVRCSGLPVEHSSGKVYTSPVKQ